MSRTKRLDMKSYDTIDAKFQILSLSSIDNNKQNIWYSSQCGLLSHQSYSDINFVFTGMCTCCFQKQVQYLFTYLGCRFVTKLVSAPFPCRFFPSPPLVYVVKTVAEEPRKTSNGVKGDKFSSTEQILTLNIIRFFDSIVFEVYI